MIFLDPNSTWPKRFRIRIPKTMLTGRKTRLTEYGKQLTKASSTCVGFFNVIHSSEKGKRVEIIFLCQSF
jgi:hypothetical protein